MSYAWRVGMALLMAAAVTTAAAAQTKPKAMTAQGKVTAVAGDTLTIAKGSESMTFTIDGTTKIVGKGLSTKTNEKAAAGQKMTLTDSVHNGDMNASVSSSRSRRSLAPSGIPSSSSTS